MMVINTRRPKPGAERAGGVQPTRRSSLSWRLLRERKFRWFFLACLLSNLGTWLQNTVQVLLAYKLTHSAYGVGIVVSAQFAGTLLVSPWAAVLANRIGFKTTLIGSQVFSAFTAAVMAWCYAAGDFHEGTLIIGALCLGLAFSLALPVQIVMLSTLIEPPDIEAAMAMNSVSYNAGRALAPVLSVLVMILFGPVAIFAANGVTFAVFAVVLCCVSPSKALTVFSRQSDDKVLLQRARVTDGIKIARVNRRLLLLLAIVASVTLADDPVQVLSPGLAHTLHVSGDWVGYLIAALGWGTVLGSFVPIPQKKLATPEGASRIATRRAAIWLLVLAFSMIIFTAGISAWVSLIAAICAGGAALFTGAATQSLIVGANRGAAASVAGLWAIAWAGSKPIASLLDGWSASNIGILRTGILLALPAALLAFGELFMPKTMRERIKSWSLSSRLGDFLASVNYPDWLPDWPLNLVDSVMRKPENSGSQAL
jgi:predicted MFS family arabinose efflux permease